MAGVEHIAQDHSAPPCKVQPPRHARQNCYRRTAYSLNVQHPLDVSWPSVGKHTPQQTHDAIKEQVPDAKVVYACSKEEGQTSDTRVRSLGKCPTDTSPSFVIVDERAGSISRVLQMLRRRPQNSVGVVIIVLLHQLATMDCSDVTEMVSAMVQGGADDVLTLPTDIAQLRNAITLSLAKARASKQHKSYLEREVRAARNQCEELFWRNVEEILPGFPPERTELSEICGKSVGTAKLVCPLGEGAFAKVFLWEDPQNKVSTGAVKIIPKSKVSSVDRVVQIATEFDVLQRLQHPNVARAFNYVHGRHNLYIFMEVAGTTNLRKVIEHENSGCLRWDQAQLLLLQVSDGLAYCHEQKIAHCDLKPENIVVSGDGLAKLVDFGQAIDLALEVPTLEHPRGTMPFIAPEIMCLSPDWIPTAADSWALGVVLLEMLCGIHAFTRLLRWQDRDLKNAAELSDRADEVVAFFSCFGTEEHANALTMLNNLCHTPPPPFVFAVLVDMLGVSPENRLDAKGIVQRIGENCSFGDQLL